MACVDCFIARGLWHDRLSPDKSRSGCGSVTDSADQPASAGSIRVSWSSASGATNASSPSPSSVSAAAS